MEIKFRNVANLKRIDTLICGSVFMAERTDKNGGKGLYMVVDGNSGLLHRSYGKAETFAVNLSTAQLRRFAPATMVEPVNATLDVD